MQGKLFSDVYDGVYQSDVLISVHHRLYDLFYRVDRVSFLLRSDRIEWVGIPASGTGCDAGLRMALKLENLGITGTFGGVSFRKYKIS